jgi:hypothetical protein
MGNLEEVDREIGESALACAGRAEEYQFHAFVLLKPYTLAETGLHVNHDGAP